MGAVILVLVVGGLLFFGIRATLDAERQRRRRGPWSAGESRGDRSGGNGCSGGDSGGGGHHSGCGGGHSGCGGGHGCGGGGCGGGGH